MVLFIHILSIKLEKEMFFMKKFMSAILAVIMMLSIAMPVFAAEETTKSVDNTFDNFEPAPGKKAPDNWYDPYCYEADGRINKYCLNHGGDEYTVNAMYCPEAKKIFTVLNMGRTVINGKIRKFCPYDTLCSQWPTYEIIEGHLTGNIIYKDITQWYCPYCGKYEIASYVDDDVDRTESAIYTHQKVAPVVYGFHCDKCDTFVANSGFADNRYDTPFKFITECKVLFGDCNDVTDINNVKLYRFLTDAQREADYSFIFTETEKDFGDGKDGNVSDLKTNKAGYYNDWDSPDNPYQKLTFWQKIVKFFAKIALWFKNLFK